MAHVSLKARWREDNQKRLGGQHLFERRTQTLANSDFEIVQGKSQADQQQAELGFRK